jgi:benzaldehyde dehydrogenase (NAD)
MRAVADAFTDAVVGRVEKLTVGDPLRDTVDLGPIISAAQRDRFHNGLVVPSIAAGATVAVGGSFDGLFYQPTVLTGVTPEMPVFTEEIFGPVMPITIVDSEEEALELVNRHRTLMNSVFSGDQLRGYEFAQRVKANEVHVNDGYARHGGEGQLDGYTNRQWIGIQRTPTRYPSWAEAGH